MLESLGHLHVVVVHFPIALLLVGGALELWNWRRFDAQRAAAARMCMALGAASAFVAAVLGWIHADHVRLGSSEADKLAWHRWLGIASALVALAAVMLGRASRAHAGAAGVDKQRNWHLASVVLAMVLIASSGHSGGELVHGEGFFFGSLTGSKAPKPATPSSEHVTDAQPTEADAKSGVQAASSSIDIFATEIRPMLEAHCYECHGERKQKGHLRLDRIEAAFQPNDDGDWIIKRGDPAASELMRRVTLPESDEDHMPAKDESLTAEQIETLRHWIELGAPTGSTASASTQQEAAKLESAAATTPQQPVATAPPARDAIADALGELRSAGVIAQQLAQDSDELDVDFHLRGAAVTDEQLTVLDALAPKLVQLNLAQTGITDAGLEHVAKLSALEHLNLSETAVGDAGLARIGGLSKLEVLNLYGTHITDRGLAQLAPLANLKRVYIWQTQVTDAGAAALATLRPDLTVIRGK